MLQTNHEHHYMRRYKIYLIDGQRSKPVIPLCPQRINYRNTWDTKIQRCSCPIYVNSICIKLMHISYMHCTYYVCSSWYAMNSSFAFWNFMEFFSNIFDLLVESTNMEPTDF